MGCVRAFLGKYEIHIDSFIRFLKGMAKNLNDDILGGVQEIEDFREGTF